jgi:hypothetical protein
LFHVRRLWRSGTLYGEWMRDGRLRGGTVLAKNVVLLIACVALTPPSLMLPKHLRVRVAQKLAYYGGMVTAYLGLSLLRHRE